jgi:hypothetical protein
MLVIAYNNFSPGPVAGRACHDTLTEAEPQPDTQLFYVTMYVRLRLRLRQSIFSGSACLA